MSKKETQVTELQKRETSALALPTELEGAWGTENIEAKDVLIPRIFLAQKMSDVVDKSDVKAGQFYLSTTKEALSGVGQSLEILILNSFKTWTIEQKKGDKYEYHSIEPYSPSQANLPWDFELMGVTMRRNETFNYYIVLPKDIESGEAIPALLSFRRTQVKCAKAITSYLMKMKQFKAPACMYVIELSSHLEENDLGSFHVPQIKQGRKATLDEMSLCKKWYDSISHGSVKIDSETGEVAETAV